MERTLIAINLPNVITILLIGAAGYLAATVIAQLVLRPPTQRQAAVAGGGF